LFVTWRQMRTSVTSQNSIWHIAMSVDVNVIKRNYCCPVLHSETQANAFIVDLAVPLGVSKRSVTVRRGHHIVDQTYLAQIEAVRQMESSYRPVPLRQPIPDLDLGSCFQRMTGSWALRTSTSPKNDRGVHAQIVQSSACQSRDPTRGAWYRIEAV
jgi:hypothetical protein